LIAGVGGQGALLASRIIGGVAIQMGLDVKVSEVHGMSQRGGSVETFVRFDSKKVHSPLIDKACADFILAFEAMEACRYIDYLKQDGIVIASTQQINPMPVITGAAAYPPNLLEKLKDISKGVIAIDALQLAAAAGSEKMVNVVLIGVLAACLDFPKEEWVSVIRRIVPEKLLEKNLNAFEAGYIEKGVAAC
jgi:indolepyruvate ferredoxin oxidoreductase beta subunit